MKISMEKKRDPGVKRFFWFLPFVAIDRKIAEIIPNRFIYFLVYVFVFPTIFMMLVFGFGVGFAEKIFPTEHDFDVFAMRHPEWKIIAILIAVAFYVYPFLSFIWTADIYREKKKKKDSQGVYGSARFSDLKDLQQKGFEGNGIVLGIKDGRLIEKPVSMEGHVAVFGVSGDGKGAAMAVPSLLRWEGGLICIDIKGELYQKTAHTRRSKVFLFDPDNPDTDAYDPLQSADTVSGAQEIARNIIPAENGEDSFWTKAPRALLASAIYDSRRFRMGETFHQLIRRIILTDFDLLVSELFTHENEEVRILCAPAKSVLTADETKAGVSSSLYTALQGLASDPLIDRVTKRSDWTAQDICEGAAVYMRIKEEKIDQYADLFRLVVTQITNYLTTRPDYSTPHILFLIDELPRFKRVNGLFESLGTLRSRNVHYLLFCQSLAQIDEIYGQNLRKVMFDTCRYTVVMSTNEPETQKYFSDLAGPRTVRTRGMSTNGTFIPGFNSNEAQAPLIFPNEFGLLKDELVLFGRELHPTRLGLARWFEVSEFKRLVESSENRNFYKEPVTAHSSIPKTVVKQGSMTSKEMLNSGQRGTGRESHDED